jgi:voltage-gated potassium channel Kch
MLDHTIICGYGARGMAVARSALRCGTGRNTIVVIDAEERRAAFARREGLKSVTGDARSGHVLWVANAGVAASILICLPDAVAVEATRTARSIAPGATIRVALDSRRMRAEALAAGASEVIVIGEIAGRLLADSVAPTR